MLEVLNEVGEGGAGQGWGGIKVWVGYFTVGCTGVGGSLAMSPTTTIITTTTTTRTITMMVKIFDI